MAVAKIAYCLIRREPQYRHQSFYDGLVAAGFQVNLREPRYIKPEDILLIWNRSGSSETLANCFEKAGGTVVVAENGYIGQDEDQRQLYSLAIGGHNGQGTWPEGGSERWQSLNIPLQPWRQPETGAGGHILVCPNRQIGPQKMRQPLDFVDQIYARRKFAAYRPIRVRPHPGNWQVNPPKIPLSEDLKNAWCTVIWSSSAGVHSLVAGVPVVCMSPKWICKEVTTPDPNYVWMDNKSRLLAMERLAWAQWTIREIQSGQAFKVLLGLE